MTHEFLNDFSHALFSGFDTIVRTLQRNPVTVDAGTWKRYLYTAAFVSNAIEYTTATSYKVSVVLRIDADLVLYAVIL